MAWKKFPSLKKEFSQPRFWSSYAFNFSLCMHCNWNLSFSKSETKFHWLKLQSSSENKNQNYSCKSFICKSITTIKKEFCQAKPNYHKAERAHEKYRCTSNNTKTITRDLCKAKLEKITLCPTFQITTKKQG